MNCGSIITILLLVLAALGGVRFWALFLLGWVGSRLVRRILTRRQGTSDAPAPKPPVALCAEPDGPLPFGYKTAWLAIRCEDPEQAIAALRPQRRERANWATGLAAA